MVQEMPSSALVTFGGLDENAEVVGGQNYIGELPPSGKAMPGYIRKIFLTSTNDGEAMFKVLYECTEGKYKGFVSWENVVLTNAAAFKWQPLCDVLGIPYGDLKKKTYVDADNVTEVGRRVTKIGDRDLMVTDAAPCFFGVEYKTYQEVRTPQVSGKMPRNVPNVEEFKATAVTNGKGNGKAATKDDDESFIHD